MVLGLQSAFSESGRGSAQVVELGIGIGTFEMGKNGAVD